MMKTSSFIPECSVIVGSFKWGCGSPLFWMGVFWVGMLCAACDESAKPCETDLDCREGFYCDHELFKGECVQRLKVVRCGAVLCTYPQERCVNERCVTLVDGGPPIPTQSVLFVLSESVSSSSGAGSRHGLVCI